MNEINIYNFSKLPLKNIKELRNNGIGIQVSMIVTGKKLVGKSLVVYIEQLLERKWNRVNNVEDTTKHYLVRMSDGSELITDEAGKTALAAA